MIQTKKLTEDQQKEIVELYKQGKTVKELYTQFSYRVGDPHGILEILKSFSTPIRPDHKTHAKRYSLDETYFEKIDTQKKAYFLGLMYADGYNGLKKRAIRLQLVESEKYIMESFLTDLKSNQPLKYLNKSNKNPKWQNFWILNVYNGKICDDLDKLGCVQAKTHKLKFPTEDIVPKELIHHFVRGFFDGDGCITISKGKNKNISFTTTKEFLLELQKLLIKELGFKVTKLSKRWKLRNDEIYSLVYGGNIQAKKYMDWLYKDSEIHFTRKYNKFL